MKKQNAFSLIEVLIIFTVMSVILAASLPTLSKKSSPIPMKIQQGAYYCLSNDDGTFTERLYSKKDLIRSNDNAISCTFNPPSKASVFNIHVFGSGVGGHDYVRVQNLEESHTGYYSMDNGFDDADNPLSFKKITDNDLYSFLKGQKIIYKAKIANGGDGGSIYNAWIPTGLTYCEYYEGTSHIVSYTMNNTECKLKGSELTDDHELEGDIRPTISGGSGGNGGYIKVRYTIPTEQNTFGQGSFEKLYKYLIGRFSTVANGTNGTTGSGYGTLNGSVADAVPGKKKCGPGSDATGKTTIRFPGDDVTGDLITKSNATNATGGTGAELGEYKKGVDCRGTKKPGKPGTDATVKDEKGNRWHVYRDTEGGNQFPGLQMDTEMTYRKYVLGVAGDSGQHAKATRYTLEGPCEVIIPKGGEPYREDDIYYPSEYDLTTRFVCPGFELTARGGRFSAATEDKYSHYSNSSEPTQEEYKNESSPSSVDTNFFKNVAKDLDDRIANLGRGGDGAGFIDKCNTSNKNSAATNRFKGTFNVFIINTADGNARISEQAAAKEELKSKCIDLNDKTYGTVQNNYEVIPATAGHGGGVVVIW